MGRIFAFLVHFWPPISRMTTYSPGATIRAANLAWPGEAGACVPCPDGAGEAFLISQKTLCSPAIQWYFLSGGFLRRTRPIVPSRFPSLSSGVNSG